MSCRSKIRLGVPVQELQVRIAPLGWIIEIPLGTVVQPAQHVPTAVGVFVLRKLINNRSEQPLRCRVVRNRVFRNVGKIRVAIEEDIDRV